MTGLAKTLQGWLPDGAILVTLTSTEGSTPRDSGALMIVSASASA